MTRRAKAGSTQRHKKLPEDATPWEEFTAQRETSNANAQQESKAEGAKQSNKKDKHMRKKLKTEQSSSMDIPTDEPSPKLTDLAEPSTSSNAEANCQEDKTEKPRKKHKKKKRKAQSLMDSSTAEPTDSSEHLNDAAEDPQTNEVTNLPSESPSKKKNNNNAKQAKKKNFMDNVREERLQNGILLLPSNIERKLYKMKKGLRAKGMPEHLIKQTVRQVRRREELTFRKTLRTCFNCRRTGHILSDCPLIKNDSEQGTGICFKCGSTEHTSFKCHVKTAGFPFAKCFICHEQGHLSRNCPKNTHGAYPKGGKCKVCGEIDHLAKDCPKSTKVVEEEEMTVDTIGNSRSVDDEAMETRISNTVTLKKSKVVKF